MQTLTEDPTAASAKGTVGKTITIKGTGLLGPAQDTDPTVAFTSLGGSTITVPVADVEATANSIVVDVISGPVRVRWS